MERRQLTMDDKNKMKEALPNLTEEEEEEAIRVAEAARRAEQRAEERLRQKQLEAKRQLQENNKTNGDDDNGKIKFLTKKQRAELAKKRLEMEKLSKDSSKTNNNNSSNNNGNNNKGQTSGTKRNKSNISKNNSRDKSSSSSSSSSSSYLTPAQLSSLKQTYLGPSAATTPNQPRPKTRAQKRNRIAKKVTFRFEWDDTDDTSRDVDPLYDHATKKIKGGVILLNRKKKLKKSRTAERGDEIATVESVSVKPIDKMTSRDWRIFRENYDIRVRGGRAPPPLRSFRESPHPLTVPTIHPTLIESIEKVLKYKIPSPIQRQAIPIGLQRRDLIGIAETGSGKTAAFGIPLLHHILTLPPSISGSVAERGPLALVMAPTRELALQIDAEIGKLLSRQTTIATCAVVGGQAIGAQAQRLRKGAHVVVGTPGRINDCVEMTYLVLNQCSYVVLDEADRMIDLGFAPQITSILDSMGGVLKSDVESEAYRQEQSDLRAAEDAPKYRLTAMFSATMPVEVERMAKKYLRHPAVVSIGDRDSGRNARIVQRVVFLSHPSQKEMQLKQSILSAYRSHGDRNCKIMVFVNEKKNADSVARIVERMGRRSAVLHGGKTQEIREDNLELFKRGGVVLVATDVAGRGLDINDVTHVINYDLPTRSIDSYCHRIGRTGRAGKEGHATSFMTDQDEGIMAALKHYLESTGNPVPDRLARHPAASGTGKNISV